MYFMHGITLSAEYNVLNKAVLNVYSNPALLVYSIQVQWDAVTLIYLNLCPYLVSCPL